MPRAAFQIRLAEESDIPEIAELISASVRGLAKEFYTEEQIELSIRSVFGVDRQLILDRTYFVAESVDGIVGCGGWSNRRTLYGASGFAISRDPERLDPSVDPAKIRAFFIHPKAARQGIGMAILKRCEAEARRVGFSSAEMMATLPGVPLYEAAGYERLESVEIPLDGSTSIVCIFMRKTFR